MVSIASSCDGGSLLQNVNVSKFDVHFEICCSKVKTTMGAQQWKNAEDALFSLGKGNVESVDSIVRYLNRN